MVPVLSSAASMPFCGASNAATVCSISDISGKIHLHFAAHSDLNSWFPAPGLHFLIRN
jgi:hypothetical protein